MEKATWLMRFNWWLRGEDKRQVHQSPELVGQMDDDELTEEVLNEIFSGVLNRVIGVGDA